MSYTPITSKLDSTVMEKKSMANMKKGYVWNIDEKSVKELDMSDIISYTDSSAWCSRIITHDGTGNTNLVFVYN